MPDIKLLPVVEYKSVAAAACAAWLYHPLIRSAVAKRNGWRPHVNKQANSDIVKRKSMVSCLESSVLSCSQFDASDLEQLCNRHVSGKSWLLFIAVLRGCYLCVVCLGSCSSHLSKS